MHAVTRWLEDACINTMEIFPESEYVMTDQQLESTGVFSDIP